MKYSQPDTSFLLTLSVLPCLLLTRSCGGELSLVPLTGLLHAQVLAEQHVVVVGLVEGLMEMLQMV
jgi:hypothetical protein